MDVPLFVPTGAGPMSAMASVPASGRVRGPAVALLPGYEAERVRIDALRDIAHGLADAGQPVICFDYPGIGMSPSKALPHGEVPTVLGEACDWFLSKTGLADLALVGTCGGARISLTIATRNPSVTTVVAQGIPMRLMRRRVRSRVRAGLAALDWVGPKLVKPLSRGSNTEYSQTEWNQGLVDDICAAAARAHVHLVFEGPTYKDFLELKDSGLLPAEISDKLEVTVSRRGLDLLSNPKNQSWFCEVVKQSLASPVSEGIGT